MSEVINITKECTSCHEVKPLNDFGKQSATPDGYKNYCKVCFREVNKIIYNKNKKRIIKNILLKRKQKKLLKTEFINKEILEQI